MYYNLYEIVNDDITDIMKTNLIKADNIEITEIISDKILLNNDNDAVDLMSEGLSDHIIVYEHNIGKNFFDLSTRIAGDILQKFINYQVKLAIVGDFDKYPSKTLKDFIYECNKTGDHLFVKSRDEAIKLWQNK
jgi:hypothetical protein